MNKLEQEAAKIADVEVDMMQQTGYITIREVEEYKKRLKEKIINTKIRIYLRKFHSSNLRKPHSDNICEKICNMMIK